MSCRHCGGGSLYEDICDRCSKRADAEAEVEENALGTVRFPEDDRWGLWRAGEEALDLGWESSLEPGDPDFLPIRLLRLRGELVTLTDPFERGLIEKVES